MIGHNLLLLVGEHGILLLVSGNDHLYAFLQVGLGDYGAAVAHGPEGGFIYNIGQLSAGGAGGHAGDDMEVHVFRRLDLFGMHFQYSLPALKVRQLHRHPPVETAGPGEGGVKALGPVGSGKNDNTGVLLKTVHLC